MSSEEVPVTQAEPSVFPNDVYVEHLNYFTVMTFLKVQIYSSSRSRNVNKF